jgi:DNA-directed RNA polymerase specialized sigma24 family protein
MDDDVTRWLDGLAGGDETAVEQIWHRYFSQLVDHARRQLWKGHWRDVDEEDIAISAFHSFYQGASQGRFPRLEDRHDLWKLLLIITSRKIAQQVRRANRAKRGSGKVRGESVFGDSDRGYGTIEAVMGTEPTPEFALAAAEEYRLLLDKLPDESLRQVATCKLEGYTNEEIAERLGCAPRTVERKLNMIRSTWSPPQA